MDLERIPDKYILVAAVLLAISRNQFKSSKMEFICDSGSDFDFMLTVCNSGHLSNGFNILIDLLFLNFWSMKIVLN